MYTLDKVTYSVERSANSGRIVLTKSVIDAIYQIGKVGRESMSVGDVVYVINRAITRADEKVTENRVTQVMNKVASDYANGECYKWLARNKTFAAMGEGFYSYK